jgi:hypothetical protein
MKALAYANGVIVFSRTHNRETLPIAEASAARLRKVVSSLARRAYDGKTLLVPGLPEAANWNQRSEALIRFTAAVNKDLGHPGMARRIAKFDARRSA